MENKILIKRTIIIGGVLLLFALFLVEEALPFIRGLVFGLLYSLLSFRLLDLTVIKALKMHPEGAKKYVFSQYSLRYLLAGIVIYVSITHPQINVIGTIVGLLILKAVIYLSTVLWKVGR